jgi:thymidylate synthase (FAD)
MTTLAKLVCGSVPVIDEAPEIDSGEAFIAYAARVSNPANQTNNDSVGLLKYLIKHKHWSPFEMVHVTMEINTTRDIARQILRHRSFSFQEFSQRYANVAALGDMFETRECRMQDTKNRQNSTETTDVEIERVFDVIQSDTVEYVKYAYQTLLEKGVAKEQARAILPEGLTKSRLYMSGTLRSWIHYCDLRRSNGTQKEHMLVADACWEELRTEYPTIIEAVEGLSSE